MKNRCCLIAVAVWLAAASAASAQPTTWVCDFKGSYIKNEDKSKTNFTWHVKWLETEKGLDAITGVSAEAIHSRRPPASAPRRAARSTRPLSAES